MRRFPWAAIIGLVLFGFTAAAQTPEPAAPAKPAAAAAPAQQSATTSGPKPEAHASIDHTALWVGDRLTYTIEVDCPAGTDILADDLSPEKLKLEGLDLTGNDAEHHPGPDDSTIYQFRYYVTTYDINNPTAKIGPMDVRYYMKHPGQRLEDATPAGEIEVPVTAVAIRSLLPDGQQSYPLRDTRAAVDRPAAYRLVESIGVGLVLISIVPAAIFAIFVGQRILRRKAGPSHRKIRAAEQDSLDAVRSTDLSTVDARRSAYAQLNTLVRAHLHDSWGISAANLTPDEIAPALSSHGTRIPSDLVTSVLAECERALYSPVEMLPSAEACRQAVKSAETVLAARR